jgi:hypothetical protein
MSLTPPAFTCWAPSLLLDSSNGLMQSVFHVAPPSDRCMQIDVLVLLHIPVLVSSHELFLVHTKVGNVSCIRRKGTVAPRECSCFRSPQPLTAFGVLKLICEFKSERQHKRLFSQKRLVGKISFLKKVAVCTGTFQTERILVCSVNQYPVGLNMTVTRWLPLSY